MNESLQNFVLLSIANNNSDEEIIQALEREGWEPDTIKNALDSVRADLKKPIQPPTPKQTLRELRSTPISRILLIIGGIATVLAGIIFVTTSWSQWGSLERILALASPTVASGLAAAYLKQKDGNQYSSKALFVVNAILFPLLLMLVTVEIDLLSDLDTELMAFAISALTLVYYLYLWFKQSIYELSKPAVLVSVVTYYFLIDLFGIESETAIYSALFYILSLLYLYVKKFLNNQRVLDFLDLMSLLALLNACFNLLRHVNTDSAFYSGLFLLITFFSLLLLMQGMDIGGIRATKRHFAILQLFFIAVLVQSSVDGELLRSLGFYDTSRPSNTGLIKDQDATGTAIVISGLVSLVANSLLGLLHKTRPIIIQLTHFNYIETVWPFLTMTGIFMISLGGSNYLFEALLLIGSIGFMLLSPITKSKIHLYTGALFLSIFIFSTGSEYFYENIGWPILLFIIGALLILLGAISERLKKGINNPTP